MRIEHAIKPGNALKNGALVLFAFILLVLETGSGQAAGTAVTIADYNFSGSFSAWTTFGNGSEGQYIPTVGGGGRESEPE